MAKSKYLKSETLPKGFEFVRDTISKMYPFTYYSVFFRYNGRLYKATYKDTRSNMQDFDECCVVWLFNAQDGSWRPIIDKSYVESIGETTFKGKENEQLISDFFYGCLLAVEEIMETENKI